MKAGTGLALVLLVTLISSANALCLLGLLQINLCALFPPCELDSLLGPCSSDELISINLGSGNYILQVSTATNIASLSLSATGNAHISLNLGALLSITGDLSIIGATVTIAADAAMLITGNLLIGVGGLLHVAGSLTVSGVTQLSGQLDLQGALAPGSSQTAWVHSSVNATGTPSAPAKITGNGGINGTVSAYGNVSTGIQDTDSSIYIAQELLVNAGATFKLAGNVTAQEGVEAYGRLHLDGVLVDNWYQHSYLHAPFVTLSGTPEQQAKLTGNGGIEGDVTLGSYSGIAAGNSPGVVSVGGNLLMYPTSFMEIEVSSANSFDRYVVSRVLMRNGILYVSFENGYLPNMNDRFSFCSHQNATGWFNTVYSSAGDVFAGYSNRSTMFIYDDPQITSYCTCSLV